MKRIALALSLVGAVASAANLKSFFAEKDCRFPEDVLQDKYSSYEFDKIKSAIGLLRVWTETHAKNLACIQPQLVKKVVLSQYTENGKDQAVIDVRVNDTSLPPPILLEPNQEKSAFQGEYKGFADSHDATTWERGFANKKFFSGVYRLTWPGSPKGFYFLACMDPSETDVLSARTVAAERGKSDFALELKARQTRCYQDGEVRSLNIAVFAGSTQTPAVWEYSEQVPMQPGTFERHLPVTLKSKNPDSRNITVYVVYDESDNDRGVSIVRERQLALHP